MRSLFASHSRSPLAFSHTHKHWRRGRRTRSRTRTASQVPQACCNPSTAALAALAAPPPRTRGAPSARPSPTLRQASPLRGSPERPSLPDAPESVGKQVFPSPRRSPTPFSFLPPFLFFLRSPRDLLWGWAPQRPCLCFPGACASWQHLAGNRPAGQICNLDLGLGELVPPQAPDPLPHSCRPAGRTGCLPPL